MNYKRHQDMIELSMFAKDDFDENLIKCLAELQGENQTLKEIIKVLLQKEYPEELLRYATFLDTI